MPFQVEVMSKEPPILLLNIVGSVTPADMADHLDALEAEITNQDWMQSPIYLIVDVQNADMSFIDVMKGSATHTHPRRGASNDPLTHGMFIGGGPMIQLLRNLFQKQSKNENLVQIFASREEAIDYIAEHHKFRRLA